MILKICGVRDSKLASYCVEQGATALGFNFHRGSPRYIDQESALAIARDLPATVLKVAVVVSTDADAPRWLEGVPPAFDVVQLHGLSRDLAQEPGRSVWIATSPDKVDRFPERRLVIDTSWGTGKKADWRALEALTRPFILAGGLTAANVCQAIRRLNPEGIDVSSGVESSPGEKDPGLVRSFLTACRNCQ